jgi:hypothetical protein
MIERLNVLFRFLVFYEKCTRTIFKHLKTKYALIGNCIKKGIYLLFYPL